MRPECLQRFLEQAHRRGSGKTDLLRQPSEPQRSMDEALCCPQHPGNIGSAQECFLSLKVFARLPLRFTQGQQERAALRLVYRFLTL